MVDSVAGYFEDHSDSKDLGRRALRGGFVSVAMQYGNGALQIVSAVIPGLTLGAGGFWIGRESSRF
jgi:PST family polysaccharide transporter